MSPKITLFCRQKGCRSQLSVDVEADAVAAQGVHSRGHTVTPLVAQMVQPEQAIFNEQLNKFGRRRLTLYCIWICLSLLKCMCVGNDIHYVTIQTPRANNVSSKGWRTTVAAQIHVITFILSFYFPFLASHLEVIFQFWIKIKRNTVSNKYVFRKAGDPC